MMDIKPRILGCLGALLLAAALGGCSANGSGGVDTSGLQGTSRFKSAPIVTVALSPKHINAGDSVTFTWQSQSATTCVGTGQLSGQEAVDGDTGLTFKLDKVGTWTFGLTCSGPGGTASDSETVTVGAIPAPVVEMFSFPAVVKPGASAQALADGRPNRSPLNES